VREAGPSASLVLDLLPEQGRGAEAIVTRLASLVRLPSSDLYGGDVTQFLNDKVDLLWFSGLDAPPRPVTPLGTPALGAAAVAAASRARDPTPPAHGDAAATPASELGVAEVSGSLSPVALLGLGLGLGLGSGAVVRVRVRARARVGLRLWLRSDLTLTLSRSHCSLWARRCSPCVSVAHAAAWAALERLSTPRRTRSPTHGT